MLAYFINQLLRLTLFILFGVTLLASCSQLPHHKTVTNLEEAIHTMTNKLLKQAKNHQEISGHGKKIVVLKPFVDANSNRVVNVSQQIEQMIRQESLQNFSNDFIIYPLTLKNLHEAQYIISGIIDFESVNVAGYNQILVLMTNEKTGKILSNSAIWAPMQKSDSKPIPMYQASPMYLTPITEFVTSDPTEKLADQELYDSLDTKALLAKAETAYEQQDYKKALSLFKLISKRPDGQLVRTYANLYQTHQKLQNKIAAEKAFSRLIEVSVQENDKLKQKFLFVANSTEFIDDKKLRGEYLFWIQQIGKYFKSSAKCFHIVGYTSQTEANNKRNLALLRARKVQQMFQKYFPKLGSKQVGKGVDGSTGFDTMDRRVEIVVVNCSVK